MIKRWSDEKDTGGKLKGRENMMLKLGLRFCNSVSLCSFTAAELYGRTPRPGWSTLTRGQPAPLWLNGPRCCSSGQKTWVLMATLPQEKESEKSCLKATVTQIHWWVEINDRMMMVATIKQPLSGSVFDATQLTSDTKRCLILQMNMLMRLKEAATSSSPQSYDSDSNSNSHQDDILDSSLESTL